MPSGFDSRLAGIRLSVRSSTEVQRIRRFSGTGILGVSLCRLNFLRASHGESQELGHLAANHSGVEAKQNDKCAVRVRNWPFKLGRLTNSVTHNGASSNLFGAFLLEPCTLPGSHRAKNS
jgi:hypothetical protein